MTTGADLDRALSGVAWRGGIDDRPGDRVDPQPRRETMACMLVEKYLEHARIQA